LEEGIIFHLSFSIYFPFLICHCKNISARSHRIAVEGRQPMDSGAGDGHTTEVAPNKTMANKTMG
jgi:hypothetical protein